MDKKISKEVVYTLPNETEEDIKIAEDIQARLYEKYESVQVYPNGLHEVRIIAKN